jgi:phage FluMu protein Com
MRLDSHPELEFKRIENAQNRKLVYALSALSLVGLALFLMDRRYPGSPIHWIFRLLLLPQGYLFYRLMRQAGKVKSVLPAHMEAKRVRIGKSHNRLTMALLAATGVWMIGATWVSSAVIPGHKHAAFFTGLLLAYLMAGYGLYRIIQHDNALCREIGYMCPACHKPLYEARAATYLNGRCPKCKNSILAEWPTGTVGSSV